MKYKVLFLFHLLFVLSVSSFAQLVGGNVFMKGTYVELGIAPNGAFGTTINAPVGYHPRPTPATSFIYDPATNTSAIRASALGFVADYDKNGFTNGSPAYFGDYFMPGSPKEGFSIYANNLYNNAWTYNYTSPTSGFTGTGAMTGSNTSVNTSGGVTLATWTGTMGNMQIKQTTRLGDTNLFFSVSVTLKNTGASTISNVYYMRHVDPDNDVSITPPGSATYYTDNSVDHQLPNSQDKVLVSAKGTVYTNAYLGIGTKDCRAKSFIATGSSPIGSLPDFYNGTSGNMIYSGTVSHDVCIGLIYQLGNIAPGDSVSFSYAYVLKEQDLDPALAFTEPVFVYNNRTYKSGDTVYTCQNSSGAKVSIGNGNAYTWSWSPAQGLSNITGLTNTILLPNATPKTYTITGTPTLTNCSQVKTLSITIAPTIAPPPPTVTPNVFYCINNTATTLTPTGPGISWYYSLTGGTAVNSITPPTATAGMTSYWATSTVDGCESDRIASNVHIEVPPAITSHPSNTTVCQGTNATLNVIATGSNLGYQWQVNTGSGFTDLSNSGIYNNVNSPSLTIIGAQTSMHGYLYRCIVWGSCAPTATSNSATLSVNPLPGISTHPASFTLCAGNPTSFTCAVSGINIGYQWQVNTGTGFTNLSNTAPYSGVTTNTLSLSNTTAAMNGYQYRCVISGACNASLPTNIATLTVHALPAIITQPTNAAVCSGFNTSFTTIATGTGISYQWQVLTLGGFQNLTDIAPYSGSTTSTLTISNTSATLNNYQYRCVISGTCAPDATSSAVTLTVHEAPVITAQPVNTVACVGLNRNINITATGSSLTYRWQMLTGLYYTDLVNSSSYSGVNTATLSLLNTTLTQAGSYRCIVTGICSPTDTSTPVNVSVTNTTSIYSQTTDQQVCTGTPIALEILTTGPVLSYHWERNAGQGWQNIYDGGIYIGTQTNFLQITSTEDSIDQFTYRCVVDAPCQQPTSNAILVRTFAAPKLTSQPSSVTVYPGSPATFTVTASGFGIKYKWQASTSGVTYVNINDNSVYTGTHTNSLTVSNVARGQNGMHFRCLVEETGDCGYSDTLSDTARLWIADPAGINITNQAGEDIIAYPNPISGDQLFVRSVSVQVKDLRFRIMNSLGAVIADKVSIKDSHTASIGVSNLSPGIYVLQVWGHKDDILRHIKFTKQ